MMTLAIRQRKPLNILLILSLVASFFIIPATTVQAGVLSSVLSTMRPILSVAGRIGGAFLGASMGAAFLPPLGMIAGGIVGWIAGGIITDVATGSLSNLAAVGLGVAGAMALGPGALGMAGGFVLGAFLGKIGMGLLKKADNMVTGGILLNKGPNNGGAALTPSVSASTPTTTSVPATTSVAKPNANQTAPVIVADPIKAAEAKYKAAYQEYLLASQNGDSAKAITANKTYQAAYQEYMIMLRMNTK